MQIKLPVAAFDSKPISIHTLTMIFVYKQNAYIFNDFKGGVPCRAKRTI